MELAFTQRVDVIDDSGVVKTFATPQVVVPHEQMSQAFDTSVLEMVTTAEGLVDKGYTILSMNVSVNLLFDECGGVQ